MGFQYGPKTSDQQGIQGTEYTTAASGCPQVTIAATFSPHYIFKRILLVK